MGQAYPTGFAMTNGDRILARYAAGIGFPLLGRDWVLAEMLRCKAATLVPGAS